MFSDIWLDMEIKQLLVILCCRVQHNKLFHQQQQENDELHKLIIFLSQNNKYCIHNKYTTLVKHY